MENITGSEMNDLLSEFDEQPTQHKIKTIKRTSFPDSSLVSHLEYNGSELLVTYNKAGSTYSFPMNREQAMSIYGTPSVGKAVLAMQKVIKGTKIEED